MPDYLSEPEWKKILKKNPTVKKTGVGEALRKFDKIKKKKGATFQQKDDALMGVKNVVEAGKRKHAGVEEIAEYFKEMLLAITKESRKLTTEAAGTTDDSDRNEMKLNDILNDSNRAKIFIKFLEKEFSDENGQFIKAVRKGENAQSIYDTYVASTGAKQVNLPAGTKTALDKLNTEGKLNAKSFIKARKDIIFMLAKDSYVRFQRTPEFASMQ